MQPHNFKSLTATLITGFALGEFVKSGPRKKLKRRDATLITGATLNTGFTVPTVTFLVETVPQKSTKPRNSDFYHECEVIWYDFYVIFA